MTFEDLVNEQMAKGCSAEVASQRVMQLYGAAALENRAMSKREATATLAEDRLVKAAADIWEDNVGLDRCEALRAARKSNPGLYRRMR